MPTWVAPSIAAELWSIPVGEVMSRVHDGTLPFVQQGGFTFIDVNPPKAESPANPPPGQPPHLRPPTYRTIGVTVEVPDEPEAPPRLPAKPANVEFLDLTDRHDVRRQARQRRVRRKLV